MTHVSLPRTQPLSVDSVVQTIHSGMASISQSITAMAQAYCEALKTVPNLAQQVNERCPEIPVRFLRGLEQIGAGLLDSRVYLGAPHADKLRRLPVTEQKKALDQPLDLLTSNSDSLKVSISSIDKRQAEQLFAADHIRSLEEQRAWLESRRTEASITNAPRAKVQWSVDTKRRCVMVAGACELRMADLADLMRRIAE